MADLPCGAEVVLRGVDDLGLEDVAGLLGGALAQELVVNLDAGHVALVAGDYGRLLLSWALHSARTQNTTVKHSGDISSKMKNASFLPAQRG